MGNIDVRKLTMGLLVGVAVAVPALAPTEAAAQTSHRQKSKNQWRNLGIAGGGAAVLGLITHNKTLTYGGLAGGAYSAYRYEQDRKSQSRERSRYRRYRRGHSGRAQRFAPSHYHRTKHGYATSWRHDGHKGY